MTIRLFLITVFTSALLIVTAQTTFNQKHDFNGGSELGLAVNILPDGYLLCGTGSLSNTGSSHYALKLVKLDFSGNLQWLKSYGGEGISMAINYSGACVADFQGNHYISGFYADTLSFEDLMVIKVDANGDSVWTRLIEGAGQDLLMGIFYDTLSHQVLVTGSSESANQGVYSAVVWVLDTMGNTIDTFYYGGGQVDYGKSIFNIADTIYVSGYSNSYGNLGEPILMKLDTGGNLADRRFYGTAGEDYYANLTLGNGKLLMWNRLDTLQGAMSVSTLDFAGNVLWRKIFPNYGYIYQAEFLIDGSVVMTGRTPGGRHVGHITKLDSLGNLMWDRSYSYNDPSVSGIFVLCTFYDFKLDKLSGAIVAFGNTQSDPALGDSTGSDFWLVKLDSMGCLVPGCDTITNVGIAPIETAGTQLTVYPNPAKYTARVLLNHGTPNAELDFTLFGLSGQAILTQKHQLNPYGFAEWIIDLDGLAPGTYIYHITSGGRATNGKLLVE